MIVPGFNYSKLDAQFARTKQLATGVANELPLKVARGFLRRVLDVTPPAGHGATGISARRQGQHAIDRDLAKIFVPVILRGKRPEQWPDVEGIYQHMMAGRIGLGAVRGQIYHVDARKLEALRQKLYARIGTLGGGWNASLEALGVSAPDWIRAHGTSRGSCSIVAAGSGVIITMTNAVEYAPRVRDYPRQVQYALNYEASALQRELDHLIADALRRGNASSV